MRGLLFVGAVLGLAALFGRTEPAPASAQPVTSSEVQVQSEQFSDSELQMSAGKYSGCKGPRTCSRGG